MIHPIAAEQFHFGVIIEKARLHLSLPSRHGRQRGLVQNSRTDKMPPMITKAIDRIEKADIDSLLTNSVAEGRTIEYKVILPGGKDEDKREFLADVSSFANATGGDLLFGVSDAAGVPDAIPGLNAPDLDAEKLRMEEIIRNGIDPRISGIQMRTVTGFPGGPVLIMRIPQSFSAPHMITFKNTSRFFTRNNVGKYQMDVKELRTAFDISGTLAERLQRFRADRLSKIVAGETPVSLSKRPTMVLHILPLSSFTLGTYIDYELQQTMRLKLMPIGTHGWSGRHNVDGFVSFNNLSKADSGQVGSDSYCQFFRNGAVEAASSKFVAQKDGEQVIPCVAYERNLLDVIQKYFQGLNEIGVPLPLLITLSMIGVKGVWLYVGFDFPDDTNAIDRDTLLLPEVLVESFETDVTKLMRPIFDAVWNAAGYERSYNYDSNGKWNPG